MENIDFQHKRYLKRGVPTSTPDFILNDFRHAIDSNLRQTPRPPPRPENRSLPRIRTRRLQFSNK